MNGKNIIRCKECIFSAKEAIKSIHKDSRIIHKYRCLLGHGRGNYVGADDFCSWAKTEDEYFAEIKNIAELYGFEKIYKYDHFSAQEMDRRRNNKP